MAQSSINSRQPHSPVSIALIIGLGLIYLSLLGSSLFVFLKGHVLTDTSVVYSATLPKPYPKHELLDTGKISIIAVNDEYYRLDSLILFERNITSRIGALESRENQMLDDIRQETNNIINKVNGWLGFWIAVLALVGGIIPIIIQFVYMADKRREDEELRDKLESDIANFKDAQESILRNMTTNVNSNKVCNYINSLCLNLDNRLLVDSNIRNELTNYLAQNIIDTLCQLEGLLYSSETDHLAHDKVTHMLLLLIQIITMLDEYRMLSRIRRADIILLQTQVEDYISQIISGSDGTIHPIDLKQTYRELCRRLRSTICNGHDFHI